MHACTLMMYAWELGADNCLCRCFYTRARARVARTTKKNKDDIHYIIWALLLSRIIITTAETSSSLLTLRFANNFLPAPSRARLTYIDIIIYRNSKKPKKSIIISQFSWELLDEWYFYEIASCATFLPLFPRNHLKHALIIYSLGPIRIYGNVMQIQSI